MPKLSPEEQKLQALITKHAAKARDIQQKYDLAVAALVALKAKASVKIPEGFEAQSVRKFREDAASLLHSVESAGDHLAEIKSSLTALTAALK